jgi:hypothetical protein
MRRRKEGEEKRERRVGRREKRHLNRTLSLLGREERGSFGQIEEGIKMDWMTDLRKALRDDPAA